MLASALRRRKPEGPHGSMQYAAPGPLGLPVHSAALFTVINLADQQFADPAGTRIPKMVPTGLHQALALLSPLAKKGGDST